MSTEQERKALEDRLLGCGETVVAAGDTRDRQDSLAEGGRSRGGQGNTRKEHIDTKSGDERDKKNEGFPIDEITFRRLP
uniref:Uncharacterized protein n=1 Tax=Chenopodium quinoa TaxID=63459 RepID=A0A803M3V5_CHEQI